MKKLTHEEFIKKLKNRNKYFRDGVFTVESEYIKATERILTKTQFGMCSSNPNRLLAPSNPGIVTAVDKTQYCINQFKHIHGDKYDYSLVEYTNEKTHVEIVCSKHGSFMCTPSNHKLSRGCKKCRDQNISDNPIGWTKEDWVNKAIVSKHFDSFKVYIIRCWNDDEEFFKVGRTYTTIERRFNNKREMPYEYEIIKEFTGGPDYVYNLEEKLHQQNLNKYTPLLSFRGSVNECYKTIKYEH